MADLIKHNETKPNKHKSKMNKHLQCLREKSIFQIYASIHLFINTVRITIIANNFYNKFKNCYRITDSDAYLFSRSFFKSGLRHSFPHPKVAGPTI